MSNDTIFFHGLADDLGVRTSDLRHFLLQGVSNSVNRPTTDQKARFVLQSNVAQAADDVVLARGATMVIQIDPAQYGMFPMAGVGRSRCGIEIVISGVGADDDVYCKVQLANVLPNGELYEVRLSSGNHVVELPQLMAMTSALAITLVNPTDPTTGTDFAIGLGSWMTRAKSAVSAAGRAELEVRYPGKVGGAKGALFGTMGAMIQEGLSARDRVTQTVQGYLKGGRLDKAREVASQVGQYVSAGLAKATSGGLLRHKGAGKALLSAGAEAAGAVADKVRGIFGRR